MFRNITRGRRINRGAAFGLIIVTALLAFEIFNYSTTQFALADVLGDLKFAGLRWATILAIALPVLPASSRRNKAAMNPLRFGIFSARGC
jgi:hypothetical protein